MRRIAVHLAAALLALGVSAAPASAAPSVEDARFEAFANRALETWAPPLTLA